MDLRLALRHQGRPRCEGAQRVDFTAPELIAFYEKEFGAISLSPAEMRMSLWTPSCSESNLDAFMRAFMLAREARLVRAITEAPHPKIIVLYGAGHLPSVQRQLSSHGWKEICRRQLSSAPGACG